MTFNKRIFFISFLVFFVIALPPLIVIPLLLTEKKETLKYNIVDSFSNISKKHYVHHYWDIEKLKEEIKERKNFVVYYGTPRCPACKEATKKINNNSEFKNKIKSLYEKTKQAKWVFFYDNKSTGSEERKNFDKELNKIIKESDQKEIEGVPAFIFFKNGKVVDTLTGIDDDLEKLLNKIDLHFE